MALRSMMPRWSDIEDDEPPTTAEHFVPAIWDVMGCSEKDANAYWNESDLKNVGFNTIDKVLLS